MSKSKKQDSTEQKRQRADLIARILQQRCPELHDLNYQNYEAKNDPPDLVFGEQDSGTGFFPIGVELMEFHLGKVDEKGSLLRRIEEQKEKLTNAAWEKFRTYYPDELYVSISWYEADDVVSQNGYLPVSQSDEVSIVNKLVQLVSSQAGKANTDGIYIDSDLIEEAGLSGHVFSLWLAKIIDEAGVAYPNWSSSGSVWTGVYPHEVEHYIQSKEGKPFKQNCQEKWLVLITDVEGKISTYMRFMEYQVVKSSYFDRVLKLRLSSQSLVMIAPRLRILSDW